MPGRRCNLCTNPNAMDTGSSEDDDYNPVDSAPQNATNSRNIRCNTRCPTRRPPRPRCKHGFYERLRNLLCEFFGFEEGQFPGKKYVCIMWSVILVTVALIAYFGHSLNSKMDRVNEDVFLLKYNVKCIAGSLDESAAGMCARELELSQLEHDQKSKSKAVGSKQSELQRMIQQELETYDADRNGKVDYALESAGGSIIDTPNTNVYVIEEPTFRFFGLVACRKALSPSMILQPATLPGECWPFEGSKGTILIKLLGSVKISGFSVEHIPKSLSPTGETSSAPKDFSFRGLEDAYDKDGFEFGRYKYDNSGSRLQYFEAKHINNKAYSIVQFKVYSNHGNPDYTCIYRVRVHGSLQ